MAEPDDQAAPSPPSSTPKPAFFHRWMRHALLVAVVTGLPAGGWYYQYTTRWNHKPPKVDMCFQGLSPKLKDPVSVSASEPFLDRTTNETIYLTDTQYRAAQCADGLNAAASSRLARAFALADSDAQARALASVVTASTGTDPAGEKEAVGLWMLASAAASALPKSDVRDAAMLEMDEFVGCRFDHQRLPACSARPPFPVGIWGLGGVGAFALALVLASLVQTLGARIAIRLKNRSTKKAPAR